MIFYIVVHYIQLTVPTRSSITLATLNRAVCWLHGFLYSRPQEIYIICYIICDMAFGRRARSKKRSTMCARRKCISIWAERQLFGALAPRPIVVRYNIYKIQKPMANTERGKARLIAKVELSRCLCERTEWSLQRARPGGEIDWRRAEFRLMRRALLAFAKLSFYVCVAVVARLPWNMLCEWPGGARERVDCGWRAIGSVLLASYIDWRQGSYWQAYIYIYTV